jgi:hypothetical protein
VSRNASAAKTAADPAGCPLGNVWMPISMKRRLGRGQSSDGVAQAAAHGPDGRGRRYYRSEHQPVPGERHGVEQGEERVASSPVHPEREPGVPLAECVAPQSIRSEERESRQPRGENDAGAENRATPRITRTSRPGRTRIHGAGSADSSAGLTGSSTKRLEYLRRPDGSSLLEPYCSPVSTGAYKRFHHEDVGLAACPFGDE